VAEVLMIRRILSTGKKALLVLPYVALCTEKVPCAMLLSQLSFSTLSRLFITDIHT